MLATLLMVFAFPTSSQAFTLIPNHSHHNTMSETPSAQDLVEMTAYLPVTLVIRGLDGTEYSISHGKILQTHTNHISRLGGKSLEVYILLLEKGSELGVRDVQRELEYSSPNLAYYHLNKLHGLGYVEKTELNKYRILETHIPLIRALEMPSVHLDTHPQYLTMLLIFAILTILSFLFIVVDIPMIIMKIIFFLTSLSSFTYFYHQKGKYCV